jgi:tetratricopeptide (TPR) repeat protein
MTKCVVLLLPIALVGSVAALALAACTADPPQRVEPPAQPLVIGTSPAPMPSAAAPEKPAASEETAPPRKPLAIPARDPRLARGPSGVPVKELQQLEHLYAALPPGSPDRVNIARHLADGYAEIARVTDAASSSSAHETSLKYYEVLTNEPQYAHLDEAYYYAALEHELAGDLRKARSAYYELIKRVPASKLIPLAYFAFGEMFFAEAVADPSKDALAEQAYREVLKYPPKTNVVYVEAQSRLAEIAARTKSPVRRP